MDPLVLIRQVGAYPLNGPSLSERAGCGAVAVWELASDCCRATPICVKPLQVEALTTRGRVVISGKFCRKIRLTRSGGAKFFTVAAAVDAPLA